MLAMAAQKYQKSRKKKSENLDLALPRGTQSQRLVMKPRLQNNALVVKTSRAGPVPTVCLKNLPKLLPPPRLLHLRILTPHLTPSPSSKLSSSFISKTPRLVRSEHLYGLLATPAAVKARCQKSTSSPTPTSKPALTAPSPQGAQQSTGLRSSRWD